MPHGTWDLPRAGIEPLSPVLAGEFFTTEPPRKPRPFGYRLAKPTVSLDFTLAPLFEHLWCAELDIAETTKESSTILGPRKEAMNTSHCRLSWVCLPHSLPGSGLFPSSQGLGTLVGGKGEGFPEAEPAADTCLSLLVPPGEEYRPLLLYPELPLHLGGYSGPHLQWRKHSWFSAVTEPRWPEGRLPP